VKREREEGESEERGHTFALAPPLLSLAHYAKEKEKGKIYNLKLNCIFSLFLFFIFKFINKRGVGGKIKKCIFNIFFILKKLKITKKLQKSGPNELGPAGI
jgi:hypothetical protein